MSDLVAESLAAARAVPGAVGGFEDKLGAAMAAVTGFSRRWAVEVGSERYFMAKASGLLCCSWQRSLQRVGVVCAQVFAEAGMTLQTEDEGPPAAQFNMHAVTERSLLACWSRAHTVRCLQGVSLAGARLSEPRSLFDLLYRPSFRFDRKGKRLRHSHVTVSVLGSPHIPFSTDPQTIVESFALQAGMVREASVAAFRRS